MSERTYYDLKSFGGKEAMQSGELEKLYEEYRLILDLYNQLTQKMKAFQRRYPILGDQELIDKITEIDQERHLKHLRLLEIGKKLDKGKSDVLVDIVREGRTLEDYGLPEFSILTGEDVIMVNDDRKSFEFNLDPKEPLPSNKRIIIDQEVKRLISKRKFILVFAIYHIGNKSDNETKLDSSDYYETILNRAKDLAGELSELKAEFVNICDTDYHDAKVRIIGVRFKNEDFRKVFATILNNKERFRLTREEIEYLGLKI